MCPTFLGLSWTASCRWALVFSLKICPEHHCSQGSRKLGEKWPGGLYIPWKHSKCHAEAKKGLVFSTMLRAPSEFPCFVICVVVVFAEAKQLIGITCSYCHHLSIYEKGYCFLGLWTNYILQTACSFKKSRGWVYLHRLQRQRSFWNHRSVNI